VSDLISRLAARAVGERDAARPRSPEPFEESAPAGAPEAHDDVTAAPAESLSRARPRAAPAPEPPAREQSRAGREHDVRPTHAVARPAPASPAGVQLLLDPPQVEALSAEEPVAEPLPEVERQPGPAVPPVLLAVPVAPTEAAVPALPAAPPEAAVQAGSGHVVARTEPETVRVHIGRLEVRANLSPPPPPSRPRAEAPRRRDELPLADYLRGRR
jgi:hypothetical protein